MVTLECDCPVWFIHTNVGYCIISWGIKSITHQTVPMHSYTCQPRHLADQQNRKHICKDASYCQHVDHSTNKPTSPQPEILTSNKPQKMYSVLCMYVSLHGSPYVLLKYLTLLSAHISLLKCYSSTLCKHFSSQVICSVWSSCCLEKKKKGKYWDLSLSGLTCTFHNSYRS